MKSWDYKWIMVEKLEEKNCCLCGHTYPGALSYCLNGGQQLELVHTLIGRILDVRYELGSLLRADVMGTIYRVLCVALLLMWLFNALAIGGSAHKRPNNESIIQSGPNRPDRDRPPSAITSIPAPPRAPPIAPNQGYLSLFTIPEARIILTPKQNRKVQPLESKADNNGVANFGLLAPGRYQLQIKQDDYEPITATITIKRGNPTALKVDLISKYGAVMIALGDQAPEGIKIELDGQELTLSALKIEKSLISVPRVPVGKHTLNFSKAGFDSKNYQLEVKPGDDPGNTIALALLRAVITLKVKAQTGAEVHLDDESKGHIVDDTLTIPNLAPGEYKLHVSLDGYTTKERALALSLDRRQIEVEVELDPIPEDGEVYERFDLNINHWAPQLPPEWKPETRLGRKGLYVSGDTVALYKDTSRPNRAFNIYSDFTLILNVSFKNGRGAAWIVRALDKRNYYLFELATSQSQRSEPSLNFYVCQDGECELKRSDQIVINIEKPDDSFRIHLHAKGNTFSHEIEVLSDPKEKPRPLGSVFTNNTFPRGGIGLRAINGLEMFVDGFVIGKDNK